MLSTQIWIVIKQSANLELHDHFLAWNECEILIHSQQQPQVPNAHKRSQQSDLLPESQFSGPPKGP